MFAFRKINSPADSIAVCPCRNIVSTGILLVNCSPYSGVDLSTNIMLCNISNCCFQRSLPKFEVPSVCFTPIPASVPSIVAVKEDSACNSPYTSGFVNFFAYSSRSDQVQSTAGIGKPAASSMSLFNHTNDIFFFVGMP